MNANDLGIDSDGSMAGIKLVDLDEFTQRFGGSNGLYACLRARYV